MSQNIFSYIQNDKQIILSNDLIGFEIKKPTYGISNIINLKTNHSFMLPPYEEKGVMLWQAEFRDADGFRADLTNNSPCQSEHVISRDSEKMTLILNWRNMTLEGDKGVVDVQVVMTLHKDSSLSQWNINVENRSSRWGLWELTFPIISNLGTTGSDPSKTHVILPSGWGLHYRDQRTMPMYEGRYPSGNCVMQFLSFYHDKSGLYLATHDPNAYYKRFKFNPDIYTGTLEEHLVKSEFQIINYPEDIGVPNKSYKIPYNAVIGVFRGDWFTAAKIYRKWVLKNAPWCIRGKINEHKDIPEWFKQISLWWRPSRESRGDPDKVVSEVLRVREFFDVPIAIHWYNWHKIPFDTDYPEYFPTKEGFKDAVKKLQEFGVRVMPYINVMYFDINAKSWIDEKAERYCAKDGAPRTRLRTFEYYVHRYGSKQQMAVMCPYTEYWQRKCVEIASRLAEEYGVDGVYLDCMASGPAYLCFDPSHGHPLGGGDFWVRGYGRLLGEMRRTVRSKNPEMIMTTESNAEPYLGYLDGYLMCNSTRGDLIPLFPAVYGGYIITFGRYIFEEDLKNPVSFRMKVGEMFVFGAQLGWFGVPKILEERHRAEALYLKKLAKGYNLARKYLMLGEMLHPPISETPLPTVSAVWRFPWSPRGYKATMPVILSSAWKADDGTVGIILTNISQTTRAVSYIINAEEYELSGDKYIINYVTESGVVRTEEQRGPKFILRIIVPAGDFLILQIVPTSVLLQEQKTPTSLKH